MKRKREENEEDNETASGESECDSDSDVEPCDTCAKYDELLDAGPDAELDPRSRCAICDNPLCKSGGVVQCAYYYERRCKSFL